MATIVEQLNHNTIETYVDYFATTPDDPPSPATVIQTFTLDDAYDISAVNLMVGYYSDLPLPDHRTIRVSIYAANATTGVTTGPSLGSASTATSSYSWDVLTYQMMTFTFATAISLEAGEYAIVVDIPAGDQLWGDFELIEILPGWFQWTQTATWGPRGHTLEQYADGEAFVIQATLGAPSTGVDDWAFSIEGDLGYVFTPPVDLIVRKFLVVAANSKLFYET